jgi:hypothetical protein
VEALEKAVRMLFHEVLELGMETAALHRLLVKAGLLSQEEIEQTIERSRKRMLAAAVQEDVPEAVQHFLAALKSGTVQ